MAQTFRLIDRNTPFLLAPSVQEWLPKDHLARFVVEIVERLDLSRLEAAYAGRGSKAYHPAMLLSLLFYLCHGCLLEPEARGGHVRLYRLPLHLRQYAAGPRYHRYLPAPVSRRTPAAVSANTAYCE